MLLRLSIVVLSSMLAGGVAAQTSPARPKAAPGKTAPARKAAAPAKAPALQHLRIAFKKNGECALEAVGLGTFGCLGRSGVAYPKEFYIAPDDKMGTHYSQEYKVEMPYSILLWGQKGVYLHEGKASLRANNGQPSHGCIRLAKPNAQKVYQWLKGLTKVTVSYPWTPVATPAHVTKPAAPVRSSAIAKAAPVKAVAKSAVKTVPVKTVAKSAPAGKAAAKAQPPAVSKPAAKAQPSVVSKAKLPATAKPAVVAPKAAVTKKTAAKSAAAPKSGSGGARPRITATPRASAKATTGPRRKSGNPGWMF